MNTHYEFTEKGYQARLVAGWTLLIVALLVVVFKPAIALGLLAIGGSLVGATYYARHQNRLATEGEKWTRSSHQREGYGRLEQAREYRSLFEEGIISLAEYHHAVGNLYPELNRGDETTKKNPVSTGDGKI